MGHTFKPSKYEIKDNISMEVMRPISLICFVYESTEELPFYRAVVTHGSVI